MDMALEHDFIKSGFNLPDGFVSFITKTNVTSVATLRSKSF